MAVTEKGCLLPASQPALRPNMKERAAGGYFPVSAARPAENRRIVRQQQSQPIFAELEPWLREKLDRISQKTKLAEAIYYALSHWPGANRFLDDGWIEIDSNIFERAIRPIALNRGMPCSRAPMVAPSTGQSSPR